MDERAQSAQGVTTYLLVVGLFTPKVVYGSDLYSYEWRLNH